MKIQYKQIRRDLQNDEQLKASDETRFQLEDALTASRQEVGGIALMEVVEIIQNMLSPEEVEQIKKHL